MPDATKKSRSPSYPLFGLNVAADCLRKFYEAEGKHVVDRGVAAKTLGYKSDKGLSGRALRTISTLIQYGLLDSTRAGVKVSELGLRILVPRSEEDRNAAIKEAGKSPDSFAVLFDEFGDDFPSDDALRARLVHGLFSDDAAKVFIHALRDTIGFASISTGDVQEDKGGNGTELPEDVKGKAMNINTLERLGPPPTRPETGKWEVSYVFNLSGGTSVQITLHREKSNSPPDASEVTELRDYLEIALRGLRRQSKSEPEPRTAATSEDRIEPDPPPSASQP